jgi:thiol-disulfide isomerase/thioredoxin
VSRRVLVLVAAAGAAVVLTGAAVMVAAADDEPSQDGAWPANVQLFQPDERDPLPGFAGENVRAGEPDVDLAQFEGRPVVVNVWASWCGPCRAEQRGLQRASEELAADGVGFVGVNVRDDRAAATTYLDEFAVTYPSIYDRSSSFVQALGDHAPLAPPYTLVIDAQGRIAARILGVLPGGPEPAAQAAELAAIVDEATVEAPTGQGA